MSNKTIYRAGDAQRHPDAIAFVERAKAARDARDSVATWQNVNAMTRASLAEGANIIDVAMAQRYALLAAAEAALAHTAELRDAWMRGCLSDNDGQGGTRSNRNVDVNVQLRAAIKLAREGRP